MAHATTIVIGAGQSGLAMSKHLTDRSIDHVVLERGEVANSWLTERWDSLRLLTPNWQSRLPGYAYSGDDPDGYMTMPEVLAFFKAYAKVSQAPIRTETRVLSVRQWDGGYEVQTNQGPCTCRTLVIASGACNVANVPPLRLGLPRPGARRTAAHDIEFFTAMTGDRNPIHYDKPLAQRSPFGGLIVQGGARGSGNCCLRGGLIRPGRQTDLPRGDGRAQRRWRYLRCRYGCHLHDAAAGLRGGRLMTQVSARLMATPEALLLLETGYCSGSGSVAAVRRGYVTVVAATITMAMGFGGLGLITVLMPSIEAGLGWSRSDTSLGYAAMSAGIAIGGAVWGRLSDRQELRALLATGGVCMIALLFALSAVHQCQCASALPRRLLLLLGPSPVTARHDQPTWRLAARHFPCRKQPLHLLKPIQPRSSSYVPNIR